MRQIIFGTLTPLLFGMGMLTYSLHSITSGDSNRGDRLFFSFMAAVSTALIAVAIVGLYTVSPESFLVR